MGTQKGMRSRASRGPEEGMVDQLIIAPRIMVSLPPSLERGEQGRHRETDSGCPLGTDADWVEERQCDVGTLYGCKTLGSRRSFQHRPNTGS